MRPLLNVVATVVKEILYLLRLWSPQSPQPLDDAASELVAANAPHWPNRPAGVFREGILIEGHLSQYGPNYLIRTALAARAIHEKTDLAMEVVFNGYSHQWEVARRIYASFGISRATHLGNRFAERNAIYCALAYAYASWVRRRLRGRDGILALHFGRIKVGDLIYDDIIRRTKQKTVCKLDRNVTKAIAKAAYYYLQYRRLFKTSSYSYYISTHTAYSEYGMLCRVALASGAKVIETTDIQMSVYDAITNERLPTYHEGIRESVQIGLSRSGDEVAALQSAAKVSLNRRLESKVRQLDVQKAYAGRTYSRQELRCELDADPAHKIVFILAHVFSDAPHLSSGMLHADYYDWLVSTLEICVRASGVTWIVKPHPAGALYGESGIVEAMVASSRSGSVRMCPADLNTKSLATCADALVTVHGTAGVEFACLGVPVVLAGRPFYSGFGFTIEPQSLAEYERTLLGLKDVVPLTESETEKALQVYAIWNRQFDWDNPIITPDVLAHVWGSGLPRNVAKAYQLLAARLRVTNPRTLKLWEFAQAVAG